MHWGEDFKHMDRQLVSKPTGWIDWTTGWNSAWGPNPNPYTDVTPGWYVGDTVDGFHFGDAGLAEEDFTFRLQFDDTDWLYGANTYGAPNTLGGDMTFWFGGWMGDASNPYQYIYEGNMVLRGREVPEPTSFLLLGLGLLGFGYRRLRKK